MKKSISIIFLLVCIQSTFAFEITLPSVFADHMVLQRSQKIPVWGMTEANAMVEVLFADQKKKVKADAEGNWRIDLEPLEASSEARVLTVTSQYNNEVTTLRILDVLVGEVWLCSGQSNMYRPFRMLMGEAVQPEYEPIAAYLRKEAATANDPLFRQFKVGPDYSVLQEKYLGRGNWSKAVHGEVNEFSGTAYFFGRELRRELQVPVAILSCSLGATRIEPWMPKEAYQENDILKVAYNEELAHYKNALASWDTFKEDEKYKQLLTDWEVQVEQAEREGKKAPSKPRKSVHPDRDRQIPATLFNAMIHPLIPFAVKGALWYQGESNTEQGAATYGLKLSNMIESWRKAWGQDTFYFYTCQLANYKTPNQEPVADEDGWALVSYGQSQSLKLPNTGLAVLNDIGEEKDIHPKNKIDAGKRLSLWALNQAYKKDIVYSGPLYKTSTIKGDKIIIEFDNVGSGLMVGKKQFMEPTIEVQEPLSRFQIKGTDGLWKWAKAKILNKNQVEVWHTDIEHPVEVRYAWSSNPQGANLYNKEGLPTSLFKTQD